MCIYGSIYQGIYACISSYIFTLMIYNWDDARTDGWLDGWIDGWRCVSTHICIHICVCVFMRIYIYMYIESIRSLNKFQMSWEDKWRVGNLGWEWLSLSLSLFLSILS